MIYYLTPEGQERFGFEYFTENMIKGDTGNAYIIYYGRVIRIAKTYIAFIKKGK